ncbi:MAG: MerR family transcriptional regulator [Candidatus Nanopelagicales bacterium]
MNEKLRSIQEVAQLIGTTSRTLRHYDDIGLLPPSHVGSNGYRYYDQASLTRLQRILLLRQLGLGLAQISDVLDGSRDDAVALEDHATWLRNEQERLGRQLASVERSITALKEGTELMPEQMLDGFDHVQYRDEVEQRWGQQAYVESDEWWRGLTPSAKDDFKLRTDALMKEWIAAAESGDATDSEATQALAARHVDWLSIGWGGRRPTGEQVAGLAEMYVVDERFTVNFGGATGATYARDALVHYAETMEP